MKKILSAFISVALLLTACTENPSTIEQNTNESTTEQSSEYDPFAKTNDEAVSSTVGSYNYGVEWEEGKELVLDYAPTVSFRYFVNNSGNAADFGLLIFVNGIRQPYRTEENTENKLLHIFDVQQNERKVQTIEFEPVVGEMGDEVSVEIISMFEPSYINTENSVYNFYHNISSLLPSKMNVTEKTNLSEPEICSDYMVTSITEEMLQEFNSYGSENGNPLDNQVYIDTLKNEKFYTPKALLEEEPDITPFTLNDTVTLCMYGGAPCKYRVSMYINHDLVAGAFDGADYIDITTANDSICKKTININNLNIELKDYNYLYFIAVPFYTEGDYEEKMVMKSSSVTLTSMK